MKFQELDNKQWNMLSKHLLRPARTGRPRSEDRTTINGIIYVLTTGCRWSDMPKIYGDDSTVNRRLNDWQNNNIWKKILSEIIKTSHKSSKIRL